MFVFKFVFLLICSAFVKCRLVNERTERELHEERAIVNGLPSPTREFYAIVAVTELLPKGGYVFYVCGGGSLIRHNWVVTSAHCLNNSVYTLVEVREFTDKDSVGKVYRGKKFIHPDWDHSVDEKTKMMTVRGDIALFKLNDTVAKNITPVVPCYEKSIAERTNHKLIAMGMGSTTRGKVPMGNYEGLVLSEAVMEEPLGKCPPVAVDADHSKEICTYSQLGNAVCAADGGGPLVKLSNYNQSDVCLYGTISYGDPTCKRGVTAFTRVTSYKNWIKQTIAAHSDDVGEEDKDAPDEGTKMSILNILMKQLSILVKTPKLFRMEKTKV